MLPGGWKETFCIQRIFEINFWRKVTSLTLSPEDAVWGHPISRQIRIHRAITGALWLGHLILGPRLTHQLEPNDSSFPSFLHRLINGAIKDRGFAAISPHWRLIGGPVPISVGKVASSPPSLDGKGRNISTPPALSCTPPDSTLFNEPSRRRLD